MGLHKAEVTERKLANIFVLSCLLNDKWKQSWLTFMRCTLHVCKSCTHVHEALPGGYLLKTIFSGGWLFTWAYHSLELRTFYVIAISSCILSSISFSSHLLYFSAAAHSTVTALFPKPCTSSDGRLPTCGNAFTIANCFAGRTVSFGWMKTKHIIWRMCSRNLLSKLADFCTWAQFLGCV